MLSSVLSASGLTSKPTMPLICRQTKVSIIIHIGLVEYRRCKNLGPYKSNLTLKLYLSGDLIRQKNTKNIKDNANLLPVAVFDAGVTDGC